MFSHDVVFDCYSNRQAKIPLYFLNVCNFACTKHSASVFFSMHRTFVNVRLFHGNERKTLLLNIKTLLGREVLSCFTGGFY